MNLRILRPRRNNPTTIATARCPAIVEQVTLQKFVRLYPEAINVTYPIQNLLAAKKRECVGGRGWVNGFRSTQDESKKPLSLQTFQAISLLQSQCGLLNPCWAAMPNNVLTSAVHWELKFGLRWGGGSFQLPIYLLGSEHACSVITDCNEYEMLQK